MSDRLAELRRQRGLVQEHLAWLEREVAALEAAASASAPARPPEKPLAAPPFVVRVNTVPSDVPAVTAPPTIVTPTGFSVLPPAAIAAAVPAPPEALIEQYRVEPSVVKNDVRKGCLLYFAAAFAVLILIVVVLYYTLSAR